MLSETDKKMKLFILLAALIAFGACYDPLSDEVSRWELLFRMNSSLIELNLFSSLSRKSTQRRRHGKLDVISMKIKILMCSRGWWEFIRMLKTSACRYWCTARALLPICPRTLIQESNGRTAPQSKKFAIRLERNLKFNLTIFLLRRFFFQGSCGSCWVSSHTNKPLIEKVLKWFVSLAGFRCCWSHERSYLHPLKRNRPRPFVVWASR